MRLDIQNEFIEKIPEVVQESILWDISLLCYSAVEASERFKLVLSDPDSAEYYLGYFTHIFGAPKAYRSLLISSDICSELKKRIERCRKIQESISVVGNNIFSFKIKDQNAGIKISSLYYFLNQELVEIWKLLFSNFSEQLASFEDRNSTSYLKHIMDYKRGVFGNSKEDIIDYTVKNLAPLILK